MEIETGSEKVKAATYLKRCFKLVFIQEKVDISVELRAFLSSFRESLP